MENFRGRSSMLIMGSEQLRKRKFINGSLLILLQCIFIYNIPGMVNGLMELMTLGTKVQQRKGFDIIQGDNSIHILVNGIIILFLLAMFVGVYIHNVKAARKVEDDKLSLKEGIIKFYDKNFHFIGLAPAALLVVFFVILPIAITVCVAFTNYSAPNNIPPKNLVDWVGMTNFANILKLDIWAKTFTGIATWTFTWAVLATISVYVFGFILALCLNRDDIKLKGMWRFIFILPYAVPAFVSLLVFRLMFNNIGPMNGLLQSLGFDAIPFFTDPMIAKAMVIGINTWVGAPYFMLLITSSLANIPVDIYEAAEIDGASSREQFWYITMPMVLFQTAPSLVLTFAHNFNNFGAVYLLTGGGPVNAGYRFAGHTDILITWIYKLTLDFQQYNMAAVITILIFIFLAVIARWQFSRMKYFKEEK